MRFPNFNFDSLCYICIFWEQHPALLYGLTFTLSAMGHLETTWALFPLLIITPTIPLAMRLPFIGIIGFTLAVIPQLYLFPKANVQGEGIYTIQHVSQGRRGEWLYRGTFRTFDTKSERYRRVPCMLFAKERYCADCSYLIKGILRPGRHSVFSLKTQGAWNKVSKTSIPREWRISLKKRLQSYLEKHIPYKRAALFLGGLSTGELADRAMLRDFGQLGLSHIMAISGFHFAILALTCYFLLHAFLPCKINAVALLIILSSYYLFVGSAPSIQRAWIMSGIFLLGQLFEKRASALNSLGVALICGVLLEPYSVTHLGFQLSFGATAAILLLSRPVDASIRILLPKHSFSEVIKKNVAKQHLSLLLAFLRESLSLTVAVHLALLPLLLNHFHAFGWHSLAYNLFFPFLASFSLILLICGFLFPPLHSINGWYTDGILSLAESAPIPMKVLYVEGFPGSQVACILTSLFLGGIILQGRRERLKAELPI